MFAYGGDTVADELAREVAALRNLSTSIALAKQTGQTVAAQQLQVQFNALQANIRNLIAQQGGVEQGPGGSTGWNPVENALANIRGLFTGAAKWAAIGLLAIFLVPRIITAVKKK